MRPDKRGGIASRLAAVREASTLVLLLLVIVGAAAKEPRFLEPTSVNSVLLWIPLLTIVALGQMMVIVTRGIDVSVGSTLGLAGICVGMLFKSHPEMNVYLAAATGLAIGCGLGAVNGVLVSLLKVPPIIVTLGTLNLYRGLAFIVSGGEQVDSNNIPDALMRWSLEGPLHFGRITVPWILVLALAAAAGCHMFLQSTRTGRGVFALGSNPEAARLRGMPVGGVTLLVYTVCGGLAGLAGVLYASRYGFVNPATAGQGFELTVIAATVIGGTNIFGGSGSVAGVVLGCLLLGVINVALAVLGIAATWQLLVYGLVILIAMLLDSALQRRMRLALEGE